MSSDLVSQMDNLAALALGGPVYVGPIAASGDERSVGAQLIEATSVANVDLLPSETVRFRYVKRVLYRLARLFLHRQRAFNLAMINAVADLNQQVAILRARTLNDGNRVAARLVHLGSSVDEMGDQLDRTLAAVRSETVILLDDRTTAVLAQTVILLDDRTTAVLAQTEASATAHQHEVLALLGELSKAQQGLRAHVTALHAEVDTIRTAGPTPSGLSSSAPAVVLAGDETAAGTGAGEVASTADVDGFYERFEDRFRGSAESVRGRLETYLTDLEGLRSLGGPVIDVGSGRGEWLDLLAEAGFDAQGVDTNADAVSQTRDRGRRVHHGDAIAYLRSLPAASAMAVTCFHLIEHLPADRQLDLSRAALRCLKPGGKLIIETPNPTNLNVGAATFYLDPTHLRPVNPDYLTFLLDDLGFSDVETRFLHPYDAYVEVRVDSDMELSDEIMWALRGPRDFAVLATVGDAGQLGL